MLISQAFPSEYLKASDLKGQSVMVVIEAIELREVGDEVKPVLYFRDKEKGLVANKTNANNIAVVYGDDTDDWMGREVVLYEMMVDFQGHTVPAIRVRIPKPTELQNHMRLVQSTAVGQTVTPPRGRPVPINRPRMAQGMAQAAPVNHAATAVAIEPGADVDVPF